jgi:hypothetical protein
LQVEEGYPLQVEGLECPLQEEEGLECLLQEEEECPWQEEEGYPLQEDTFDDTHS